MDKRKYADRRLYLIEAVRKRRRKVREMSIEYKGGQCTQCGYNRCFDALEFHHQDSSKKDFGISDKGYTRSWEKIRAELDKCVLVCANCHREIHANFARAQTLPEPASPPETDSPPANNKSPPPPKPPSSKAHRPQVPPQN